MALISRRFAPASENLSLEQLLNPALDGVQLAEQQVLPRPARWEQRLARVVVVSLDQLAKAGVP